MGAGGQVAGSALSEPWMPREAILLQYLLRFVRSDGTAVEIFMPELAVLDARA